MTAEGTAKPRKRAVEIWHTVAVSALPAGWRNIYDGQNGENICVSICPALLLQELREVIHCRDVPTHNPAGPPYRLTQFVERLEAPYDTRVVYAEDDDCGGVEAATDTRNYRRTVGPGEDAS
jgi:hypothetical protein